MCCSIKQYNSHHKGVPCVDNSIFLGLSAPSVELQWGFFSSHATLFSQQLHNTARQINYPGIKQTNKEIVGLLCRFVYLMPELCFYCF